MKRIGRAAFCLLLIVVSLAGCSKKESPAGKWALRPMLLVEDTLYLDTGKRLPPEEAISSQGKICSSVDVSAKPTENGQSNFGYVDAEYGYYQDGLAVRIDGGWTYFEKEKIPMSRVIELSKRGDALTWDDFARYGSEAVGFGLYILRYQIDGEPDYYLLVGGPSMQEKPWYIRLVNANDQEEYIDLRTEDAESFLSK